jgi:hypothetical protein
MPRSWASVATPFPALPEKAVQPVVGVEVAADDDALGVDAPELRFFPSGKSNVTIPPFFVFKKPWNATSLPS